MPKTRESISLALRFAILRRDNNACQYCGARAPDTFLHIDHIIPVAEGGANDPSNLITACYRCNLGKGVQPAKDESRRPETERERKLRIERDLDARVHSWAWWVGFLPIGSVETKAVLFALAHFSDPAAEFSVEFNTLATFTALPVDEVRRICVGLEATGLILPQQETRGTVVDMEGAGPPSILGSLHAIFDFQRGGDYRPPYKLDDYVDPSCFSGVEGVH